MLRALLLTSSLLSLPPCAAGVRGSDQGVGVVVQAGGEDARTGTLAGTYREVESQDKEIGRKVLAATARLEDGVREGQARALMRILRAEPVFSVEQYGTTVVVNYPEGVRVPYEADGRTRVMRATGGESVTVRADSAGGRLTVDLTWSGGERLRLRFERAGSDRLVLTRTAGNRNLLAPITVESVFERVSAKPTRSFKF